MTKPKPKAKTTTEDNSHNCPQCLKKGKKVTMTTRGTDSEECSQCHLWRQKALKETKAQKVARLTAELKAAEEA